jgi:hypothetical protein
MKLTFQFTQGISPLIAREVHNMNGAEQGLRESTFIFSLNMGDTTVIDPESRK